MDMFMVMKRSTHFRLSPEALSRLDAEAHRRGLSRTAIIETLLRELAPAAPIEGRPPMSTMKNLSLLKHPQFGLKHHQFGDDYLIGTITDVKEVTVEVDDPEDPQRTRFAWTLKGEGAAEGKTWYLETGLTIYPQEGSWMATLTRLVLASGLLTEEEVQSQNLPERDLEDVIGCQVRFKLNGPYTISQIDPTTITALEMP
jgi:hypothetical protein